ncbi:MAG: hypothetical protein MMC33_000945 [Icmadophila ericetorum]|nr:hypothetical protein [Icmadophila ericetorum]
MVQDTPQSRLSPSTQIFVMAVVLTMGNLALTTSKNSRVYLFEQAICSLYYRNHPEEILGTNQPIDEALCKNKEIQHPLSWVVGIDSFLQLLPAILVLATYEHLLLRMGLRYLVLLNCVFSAASVGFSTTVFWLNYSWATYVAPLSFIFDVIGGSEMVRITIIITCIAEISPPDRLTKTYNYISGTYLIAGMGGAAFGSVLLSHHVYLLNGLSIFGYVITAWIAMLIPRQVGMEYSKIASDVIPIPVPEETSKDEEDLDIPHLLSSSTELSRSHSNESLQGLIQQRCVDKDPPRPLLHILLHTWRASYTSLLTLFSPPNPTFTVILLFLLNSLAQHIQVLLPQYTSLLLGWSLERVNAALALKNLVSALFLFVLPTFRTRYLQPRISATPLIDLLISQTSLIANMIGIIGLAISPSAIPFIISLSIYTSGVGLQDSLTAYGTLSLPPEETVPDFYTRTGLANTLAGLVGGPLWSGMFGLVLNSGGVWPRSLPMWSCAMLFGVSIGMVGRLRRWYVRDMPP